MEAAGPFHLLFPFLRALSCCGQLLPEHLSLSHASYEGFVHALVAQARHLLTVTFVVEENPSMIDPVVLSRAKELDWEFAVLIHLMI